MTATRASGGVLALILLFGALACTGCEFIQDITGDSPRLNISPRQHRFLTELAKVQTDEEARARLLKRHESADPGPDPTQLRRVAIVETIKHGRAMFMDGRPVALNIRPTPELTSAIHAEGIRAAVIDGRRLSPKDAKSMTFVRFINVKYYLEGECAIARVTIERSDSWHYTQDVVLALIDDDTWYATQILQI